MLRIGWICGLLLLLLAAPGSAAVDEDIPAESWVYRAIGELAGGVGTAGPRVFLQTRPYTRGQVAQYMHALAPDTAKLDPGQLILFRRLWFEFHQDVDEFHQPAGEELVLRAGIQPYFLANHAQRRDGVNRAGGYVHASIGRSGRWVARSRVRLDSDARYDPRFRGEKWKDNLTANIDGAYLKFRTGNWELFWGRSWLKFGRSHNDGLLFSGFSPPMDQARLVYRRGSWQFLYFIAFLDDLYDPGSGRFARRYLAGHRITVRPWRFLELAAAEVVVFGGVDRPLEWYYLNPFIPYYWEQLNEDHDDNPLWNLEWSLNFARGWELYGEWLIDDFQIDFVSEPQQLGILVGLQAAAPFGFARSFHTLEYSRVNSTVYGQNERENRYYFRRDIAGRVIPLGSRYGPDADRLTYRFTYHVIDYLDLTATAERRRRGERDIEDVQLSGVPYGVPFPTGIVDRRWDLSLSLDFQYENAVFVGVTGGWSHRKNENNIPDKNIDLLIGEGFIRCNLWRVFRWRQ
jgi:hypothetical protein